MSRMLPEYDTVLFTQVYDDVDDFKKDFKNIGIPYQYTVGSDTYQTVSDPNITTLFYLLYARYGNNPIANRDITQFKYKLFSIIWQYGPTWQKELEIQEKLRVMQDTDIQLGTKAIHNTALNPQTEPSTGSLNELTFINQQNTTNYKRGPLEGYSALLDLLKKDVTQDFLNRFQKLFKQFARPEKPLLYVTEEEEDEE